MNINVDPKGWTSSDTEIQYNKEITDITVNDKYVSGYANTGVEKVTFGSDVEYILDNAFNSCPNLKILDFSQATKLKYIGYSAFQQCEGLQSDLDFSNCTENFIINNNAFQNAYQYVENGITVNLGPCVRLMGDVFGNCRIKTIIAPNLLSVDANSFLGYNQNEILESIYAPKMYITNGDSARVTTRTGEVDTNEWYPELRVAYGWFCIHRNDSDPEITKVVMPKNLKSLNNSGIPLYTASNCSIYYGGHPVLVQNDGGTDFESRTIYVPNAYLSEWQNDPYWRNYTDRIQGYDPITVETPFFFENLSDSDNTITMVESTADAPDIALTCSTDNVTYEDFNNTTGVTIPYGGRLYFKWKSGQLSDTTASSGYHYFASTGNVSANGNIMSLLYDDYATRTEITQKYAFHRLFREMNNLINANELLLPVTTLSDGCYYGMFQTCSSLVKAPSLPATTLASNCYGFMFQYCTSLVTAPSLPATTLATNCYGYMFYNCTSLVNAPSLPATTLAIYCYGYMFYKCTSLVNAPSLPATTLISSCYSNMFQYCSNLTTAPELPATTLATQCYQYMFNNCTNLDKVITYAKDISAYGCLTNWLYNVSSEGDFYNLGGATYTTESSSGIPSGWTEHTSLSE